MGKVGGGFSIFHALLRAERPRLLAILMVVFGSFPALVHAEEPTNRTVLSVTSTNAIKATSKPASGNTNSLSFAAGRRANKAKLPLKTSLSPTDNLGEDIPTLIVIQKDVDSVGFFSSQSGDGSFGIANVEAGYGQAYENDSIVLRGRNGTAWEEPRYLFIKKVIKF